MEKIGIMLETWIGKADLPLKSRGVELVREGDFLDCDIIVAGTDEIPIGPKCRGIVRPGAGFDNVPLAICKSRGIVCAYTPNAPSQSVAEFTLGLIIAAARGIVLPSRSCDFRQWIRPLGRELRSLTLGVVGLGRIGKRLVGLTKGMFAQVIGNDPVADTTFDDIHRVKRWPLGDLLRESDIVTLHVPTVGRDPETGLTWDNQKLISSAELGIMRPDGILINTSRGPIVDEDALYDHLEQSPGFRACIDVHIQEPYKGKLWELGNCIVTCHAASMTAEARARMESQAVSAVGAILDGERPQWVIPGSE